MSVCIYTYVSVYMCVFIYICVSVHRFIDLVYTICVFFSFLLIELGKINTYYGLLFLPLSLHIHFCSAIILPSNAHIYGKHGEQCWFLRILLVFWVQEKGVLEQDMLLLFVDIELGRSKFITQVPEEVTRDFSSLPFSSDRYIYLCNPFLLGFNVFTSECMVFVCS